jgi:hypothetical protein
MKVIRTDVTGAEVSLSTAELVLLNNTLNEVCCGLHELSQDDEFRTRLGAGRDVAKRLLDEIGCLIPH